MGNAKPLSSNIIIPNIDIESEPTITAGTAEQQWRGTRHGQIVGARRGRRPHGVVDEHSYRDHGDGYYPLRSGKGTSTEKHFQPNDHGRAAIVAGTNAGLTRPPIGWVGHVITSNQTSAVSGD
jgi:hypothetical protein